MIIGTYKNEKMFDKWLLLLPEDDNYEKIGDSSCPYCGKSEIDYLYIGNKKKMRGYLQLWCNACKHGIYISQALIPENAKMVEIRDKSIDFNIITNNIATNMFR